jgi:hypothetical protein
MTLAGTVVAAAPGAIGFDTDAVVSAATAVALRRSGFAFAVRYLSRMEPQNTGDLSTAEAQAVLDAGLALMAVQHCQRAGWAPTQALGTQYGQAAAKNAASIGFPLGVNLWLDFEGVASFATAADAIAYCNAWAEEVSSGGYVPGLYVGANQPLTGDELYWRLRVQHYWRSASDVPDISYRGYQMKQALMPSPVDGIGVDRDVIVADAFGGLPVFLAPADVSGQIAGAG